MVAYIDDEVDRVEIIYNGYLSAISQVVRRETLLPLQQASIVSDEETGSEERRSRASRVSGPPAVFRLSTSPTPTQILKRLVPDYVEISILPGAARIDRLRARRADDRDAQRVRERRKLIEDLTLQMNRARQAEITQEIMEVVAGAEGLS